MKTKCVILLWLCIATVTASAQGTEHTKWFDWGIKAGVNAPYIDIRKFEVNGIEKETPTVQSKVGYFFALFSRINLRKHYIQLEASTHYTRSEVITDLSAFCDNISTGVNPNVEIEINRRTIEVPLLYGYNFVKKRPYELALFLGPKIRYTIDRSDDDTKSNNNSIAFHEDAKPITTCIVLGLGTRISNLLLDVRYEFGLDNISKSASYKLNSPTGETSGCMVLNRRMNLMSFSLGLIF